MHAEALANSVLVSLLLILLSAAEESLSQSLRTGSGACQLSGELSQRRCRTPDGLVCSGTGECDCGVCLCPVTEPGKYYGPRDGLVLQELIW
ncbi:hypothetical protein ANANG_G00272670 [Anguilla anguilla]|uniref:Integrin beta epidermal growth factor-like domain-containing protein n=1 Tax=Anguilla anguilla TaxID=7936 RepID=A0A9D3LUX5_ANGAN|nr:hypothetical protein ANANG_G00272670 [Anguilla anguilla]